VIKKMRAVVFDVGNVLVHWAPQVIEEELARISTADRAKIRTVQQAVRHDIGLGALTAADYHRYLIESVGMDGHWDRFYEAYCLGLCRDEQALSYASSLKRRGVAVGVISNTNDVHVTWLRAQIPEFASFDSVIFSSDVGLLKPDPAIYYRSLRELGVAPGLALFVDDLPENVAGAQAVGMAGLLHRDWGKTVPSIEAWFSETLD
jgi:FMN phosphatase YigB (HAD superfamily)